jgi:hypothetical protein
MRNSRNLSLVRMNLVSCTQILQNTNEALIQFTDLKWLTAHFERSLRRAEWLVRQFDLCNICVIPILSSPSKEIVLCVKANSRMSWVSKIGLRNIILMTIRLLVFSSCISIFYYDLTFYVVSFVSREKNQLSSERLITILHWPWRKHHSACL